MAVYQKLSPTWNYVSKIKLMRPASYILSTNNNLNFSLPYSTCLSINNLNHCEKLQPFTNSIFKRNLATVPSYEFVKTERRGDGNKVGIVILDRPKVLNALNKDVIREISDALVSFDQDPTIGAIVLTGGEKAFAAGADLKQLVLRSDFAEIYSSGMFSSEWDAITSISKPIIAAVNGFALGGGCELAMMCDIIIAGEKAKFGQSEIKVGAIPGAGGTQKLAHAVGKSRAMQICLTGEMITAQQADSWGLVNSVHPPEKLLDAAVEIGDQIGRQSKIITRMVKESVNNAFEMTLHEGLKAEKRIFFSTFATDDRKEGMQAFLEKRKPNFTDR